MSEHERDRLRRLQDKFLALPLVREFVRNHGEHYPLFGAGTPCVKDVCQLLHPKYQHLFAGYLTYEG